MDDHCGIVTFTQRFRYIGSILDGSRSDEPEVVHRVQAATAAFARLKQTVFTVTPTWATCSSPLALGARSTTALCWESCSTDARAGCGQRCSGPNSRRSTIGVSQRRPRGLAPAPWHPQHAAAHLYLQAALGRPRGEDGRGEVALQVLLLLDQRCDQAY